MNNSNQPTLGEENFRPAQGICKRKALMELKELGFIQLCDCNRCSIYGGEDGILEYWKIKETKFYIFTAKIGPDIENLSFRSDWIFNPDLELSVNVPYKHYISVNLSDIFDSLPTDFQNYIIFNLQFHQARLQ
ncbi:MAG: hypothetical protein EB127_31640 [Alphaproteobacteria bacterium]|nr:hypothetical protein [Alphaproteobacteria bacterium]